MSSEEPGTCRSLLALVESSGSLDIGPTMSGSEREVESPSPVPCSSGIDSVPLPVGTVGKLPHYLSISGSCNVAVATVSPSEFVPV